MKTAGPARSRISAGRFALNVLQGFRRNQGLLLSGSVAYYTLLSIVPLLILSLIVLSHVVDRQQLLTIMATHLEMVIPSYAGTLMQQARVFLEHSHVVGIVGFMVMVFFSSLAFTVLENAMSVIFFHRVRIRRRHFLVSAIIPYVYICLLGAGIILVSFIAGVFETFENRQLVLLGRAVSLEGMSGVVLYVLGMAGEVMMLTSLYLVMPVGRITFRHALLGGVTATVLWEITRRCLVWYYATLSLVNVIYGSLATAVVTLLSIEAAAVILLLGAQVIAEFERITQTDAVRAGTGFKT